MAVVPTCSLCKIPERIRVYMESNKRFVLVYSVFFVLVLEWFSLLVSKLNPSNPNQPYDNYLMFWYPLLTQTALFVLFFTLFLWKERLHFCFRKSATTFYLSCYYLLGMVSIIFCIQANTYYFWVTTGTLGIATFIFIVSLLKSE